MKYQVIKETASLVTRDRLRLDADIYRPEASGEFPVLLMRQPYGRAIASTVVYAHPKWYAARGYIVVIQDVRGCGTSEGKFDLFINEIEDGIETVNWASQLPQSTGEVGMYGFSYQGMTQLYAAQNKPTALKVLCPGMLGYDIYADWAYENGAFCLQANLGWAVQLAAETARLQKDFKAYQLLYTSARNLPFDNPASSFRECLRKYAPSSFFDEWIAHPQPGEYWQQFKPDLTDVDLPMLHIGGWFDCYLRGTLRLYREMVQKCTQPQHLIVGVWGHLPWGRKVGAIDYGQEAASPVDELQISWFDHFLKGKNTGILATNPVRLFEMGSNQWKDFEMFPQGEPNAYYLTSNGLASIRDDAGKLSLNHGSEEQQEDILVHDPWRSVPSLGGHIAFPSGSFERSHIDSRSDVLTYTSEPFISDLHIVGKIIVELYCQANTPNFDLCAIVSEVKSNGGVYNFTQGYIHTNSLANPIQIPLQETCICLKQGNRLRLSISAACFPAYLPHSGMNLFDNEVNFNDINIITISLQSGQQYPSKLLINRSTQTRAG
ncbi:CocE/NonD family hydrolase [Spirulina sp. 06S082]|uniref:CocE/NonD family hydrolase n=1 Tax=Spirulina sp. 06S082 TaxID=3110248 RepID=UPI002B20EF75|nr:CocE/NonD family hydrolase [Spirulina sp. 06S082]MEA5469682.1 CocE/NonD family hydrolase [Spirulina sp. 06S082]